MAFGMGQFSLVTFCFLWKDPLEVDPVLDFFSFEDSFWRHLDVWSWKKSWVGRLDIELNMLPTHLNSFHPQPLPPKQELLVSIVVLQGWGNQAKEPRST